jgi:DNA-directed RNA polymerase
MQAKSFGSGAERISEELEGILFDLGREASEEQRTKFGKAIVEAYEYLAPNATKVQKFLGALGGAYAKAKSGLYWSTHTGFSVISQYHYPDIRTGVAVDLIRKHRVTRNLTVGDLPEIDKKKSASAAAANFVHSFDGSHLHDVAYMCKHARIPLVTAHDAFATTAPHVTQLGQIIRDTFISMHSFSYEKLVDLLEKAKRDLPLLDYDPKTGKFRGVKLPKLPRNTDGKYLDLNGIRKSSRAWRP